MKKFGLLGEKLGHTFSPMIHKEIFKFINIEGSYSVIELERDNLPNIIDELKVKQFNGVSVTIPYKTDIMKYLDSISDEAKKIGAINTINFIDGKTIGYNTDYSGFGMMLKHYNVDVKNKSALILGTGGVSRAVVAYLEANQIKRIEFASTNVEKSKIIYNDYKIYSYEELNELKDTDIVINCTPVGMFKDKANTPINKKYLNKFNVALDLIYNPLETTFLREAREVGLKTANGLYMLVAQAIKAHEIWNNIVISNDIIENINNLLIKELANE